MVQLYPMYAPNAIVNKSMFCRQFLQTKQGFVCNGYRCSAGRNISAIDVHY